MLVAQPDRVTGYEPVGRGFESLRARQAKILSKLFDRIFVLHYSLFILHYSLFIDMILNKAHKRALGAYNAIKTLAAAAMAADR